VGFASSRHVHGDSLCVAGPGDDVAVVRTLVDGRLLWAREGPDLASRDWLSPGPKEGARYFCGLFYTSSSFFHF
jgi:hypothetical protein